MDGTMNDKVKTYGIWILGAQGMNTSYLTIL